MNQEQLQELQSKDVEKVKSILQKFNERHASLFDFSIFNRDGQWIVIWKAIFGHLQNACMESAYATCLNTIRILTRDSSSIQSSAIVNDFNCLLNLAQLGTNNAELTSPMASAGQAISFEKAQTEKETAEEGAAAMPKSEKELATQIVIESLKCLCNVVYQSAECRSLCVRNRCMDSILRHIASPLPRHHQIELYELKLLFLITAMEPMARQRCQQNLNAQDYLTHMLHRKVLEVYDLRCEQQMELLCEVLKVLFNITQSNGEAEVHNENQNELQNRRLTAIVRNLFLLFGGMHSESERNIISHSINLLTTICTPCYSELIVECGAFGGTNAMVKMPAAYKENSLTPLPYEKWDMRVLEVILRYLKDTLDSETALSESTELISPTLTVLIKCVRCHTSMRHYIRSEVLPPLKDVSQRPEVGKELRNHLCRFLTLPNMVVRDLAAELLFVCCKENVKRMIKYTGYGNAAGLFARRGLLDCRSVKHAEYSSDSEDSDTEEYKQVQHDVNPVLGCYEDLSKRSDPFAGMSEEQKEFEVMQLVNMMDKLQRSGVVQPARIGEDGKPQPVEHILQLQEELPQQKLEQKQKN